MEQLLTIWQRERLWLTSFSSDRTSISSLPSKAFILSCLLANLEEINYIINIFNQPVVISVFPLISHQGAIFFLQMMLQAWMNLNIFTLKLVFPKLEVASAGQQEHLWPPLSSACHRNPPQRWSHGLLRRAPSRLLLTLLTPPHPAVWPGSSPLSAHFGCSLGWVLLPHCGGLNRTISKTQVDHLLWSLFEHFRLKISVIVLVELPLNIPLMEDVFPALSRPTTRMVTFLQSKNSNELYWVSKLMDRGSSKPASLVM